MTNKTPSNALCNTKYVFSLNISFTKTNNALNHHQLIKKKLQFYSKRNLWESEDTPSLIDRIISIRPPPITSIPFPPFPKISKRNHACIVTRKPFFQKVRNLDTPCEYPAEREDQQMRMNQIFPRWIGSKCYFVQT